jgi:Ca2+-binding EF-hand superfamily protein
MSKDKSVWSEIIKEVDLNGDGMIDFTEFKVMMSKFIEDKKK